jgi:NTE family protein
MNREPKKSIKLALQGGGSHGAFTWGALDRLFDDERLHIAAVSGTSAGAMNAVAVADGIARGGPAEAHRCLEKFWSSTSAAAQYSPIRRSLFDIFMGNWSLDGILVASLPTLLASSTTYATELDRRGVAAAPPWAGNTSLAAREMP